MTLLSPVVLEDVFEATGKWSNITLTSAEFDGPLCVAYYLVEFGGSPQEMDFLLLDEGRWFIVVFVSGERPLWRYGGLSEWFFEFGKRALIGREDAGRALKSYATKNYHEITDVESFSFLRSIAENNSVILIGEAPHRNLEEPDLFLQLIMYLNQFGYRDVVMEGWEYYDTGSVNRYLKTGNPEYFEVTEYPNSHLIENLYQYNKDLPDNRQIRMWFIEPSTENPKEAAVEISREIALLIEDHRSEEVVELLEWVVDDVEVNRYPFASPAWCRAREVFLKERFTELYEKLSQEGEPKMLVYYGNGHTTKQPNINEDYAELGPYLANEYERTRGKVYSIAFLPYKITTLYPDSEVSENLPSKGSVAYILGDAAPCDVFFLDLGPLADYTFYHDHNDRILSAREYDAIIFMREVTQEWSPWLWYSYLFSS